MCDGAFEQKNQMRGETQTNVDQFKIDNNELSDYIFFFLLSYVW